MCNTNTVPLCENHVSLLLQDKTGRLDHQQFKSCLRALGYDLPMVEEGQPEPEFQNILDIVDPNRYVLFSCREEYLACFLDWGSNMSGCL